MKASPFTFTYKCEVCSQVPIYADTKMCAVCTHGTASALWDWIDYDYTGNQLLLAGLHLQEIFEGFVDEKTGQINQVVAGLMHIDEKVAEKIRELNAKWEIEFKKWKEEANN